MGKFLIVSSTIYLGQDPTSLYISLLALYAILLGYLLGFSYIYKEGRAASHPVLLVWKAAALVLASWAALVALTLANVELNGTGATGLLFGGAGAILLATFALTLYLLSTSAGGCDNRRDRVELRKALLALEAASFPHALQQFWVAKRRTWRRSVTNSQLPEDFRRLYTSLHQSWVGFQVLELFGKESDIEAVNDFWQIHRLVMEDFQLVGSDNLDTSAGQVDVSAVLLPAQLVPGNNLLVHLIGEVEIRRRPYIAIIATLLDSNLRLLLLFGEGGASTQCKGVLLLDSIQSVDLSVSQVRGQAKVSVVLQPIDKHAATGQLRGERIVLTPASAPYQDAILSSTLASGLEPVTPCPTPAALESGDLDTLVWSCMWQHALDNARVERLQLAQKQIEGMLLCSHVLNLLKL
jgi:hypothetical protein